MTGDTGTDSTSERSSWMGLVTGLDWIHGRDETGAGLLVSLRAGVATKYTHHSYDDDRISNGPWPVLQLGIGWAL